jgi:hypothetical protein
MFCAMNPNFPPLLYGLAAGGATWGAIRLVQRGRFQPAQDFARWAQDWRLVGTVAGIAAIIGGSVMHVADLHRNLWTWPMTPWLVEQVFTSFTLALAVTFPIGLAEGFGLALVSLPVLRLAHDRWASGHSTIAQI